MRIVNCGNGCDEPLDNIHLVEKRQLDGDMRQLRFRVMTFRFWQNVTIAPELNYLSDAVSAVDREHAEDSEIENQDRPVKRVELVKRADVVFGFGNCGAELWEV